MGTRPPAAVATNDWQTLLKADARALPSLLSIRATELAKRGRFPEVAQAAAKLRALEPKNKDDLDYAARGYTLCAAGVLTDKPTPTDAEKQHRQQFIDLALTCLKESLAAGFDDFEHMRHDPDLTVLRDLPEFKALIPGANDE